MDHAAIQLKMSSQDFLAWDDSQTVKHQAVAAAYSWPEDPATLADDEVLRRLLALNQVRSKT